MESFLNIWCETLFCARLVGVEAQETSSNKSERNLWICAKLQASLEISLVAQKLKCLPPMRETWVRSLGLEDPLEKDMTTHSSILAWRIS